MKLTWGRVSAIGSATLLLLVIGYLQHIAVTKGMYLPCVIAFIITLNLGYALGQKDP